MPRLRSRVRDSSPAPVFKVGRKAHQSSSSGEVAKRLCSGLQSRLDGFDSRPRLQMKKIAHFRVGYFFACTIFQRTAGVALVCLRIPHFGFSDFSRLAFPGAATVSHYCAAYFFAAHPCPGFSLLRPPVCSLVIFRSKPT